jgi:zinc ribbon protein
LHVKCRSCGAEIADKAIVCYRCGTPTAEMAPRVAAKGTRPNLLAIAVLILIILAGAWLIPKTPPGSVERIGAWVVAWLVILADIAWLRRGRRR